MNDKTPMFNDKTYDVLKFIAQIFFPALGALYFSLSQIWGLPYGAEVVGTITAVDLFLGLLLGLSTKTYNDSDARFDGAIDVAVQEDNSKMFTLDLHDTNPEDLDQKKQVVFKVNPMPPADEAYLDDPRV